MFATRGRRRQQPGQQAAPPPPGEADSFYGVRSLESSIADWASATRSTRCDSDAGGGEGGDVGDAVEHGHTFLHTHVNTHAHSSGGDDTDELAVMGATGMDDVGSPNAPRAPAPTPVDAEAGAANAAADPADSLELAIVSLTAPIPITRANDTRADTDVGTAGISPTTSTGQGATPTLPARLVLSLTEASPEAGREARLSQPPSPFQPCHPRWSHVPDHDPAYAQGGDEAEHEHEYERSPRTPDAADLVSEPSSPASFTSLPSYVASLSSLSRTSSPAWSHPAYSPYAAPRHVPEPESEHQNDAHAYGHGYGDAHRHRPAPDSLGASNELVLPTLSLPSSSLHLSFPRTEATERGLRVAVVGPADDAKAALRTLSTSENMVDVGHGRVGVVRDGHMVATFVLGLTVDEVEQRIQAAYAGLHNLLRPNPGAESAAIEAMVDAYASRADWIHAVVVYMAGSDVADVARLDKTVPVLTTSGPSDMGTVRVRAGPVVAEDDTSAALVDTARIESTLRGQAEPDSYFTPRPASNSVSPAPAVPAPTAAEAAADALADVLVSAVDSAAVLRAQSTARFLASHAARPAPAPRTAHASAPAPVVLSSSGPSSVDGAPMMPTVARHGGPGGGEWEATLSRRLAARRERDAADDARGAYTTYSRARGLRRVRATRDAKDRDPPSLFARQGADSAKRAGPGAGSVADVGLAGLVGKTFARARTRWGWGIVACAMALAVGWGCWAARR
ncbi:hypothetical protein Q5752_001079 [Cryptotrichosporon argae]